MSFFDLIKTRRSIRAYAARAVEPEKIDVILLAANAAPSAGNLQAYEILVVRDAATRRNLLHAALGQ